jgi:hypothetical protein
MFHTCSSLIVALRAALGVSLGFLGLYVSHQRYVWVLLMLFLQLTIYFNSLITICRPTTIFRGILMLCDLMLTRSSLEAWLYNVCLFPFELDLIMGINNILRPCCQVLTLSHQVYFKRAL